GSRAGGRSGSFCQISDTAGMARPLISVFAVEDTAIQVVWRALPAAEVVLRVGDRSGRVKASPPAWLRRVGRPPQQLAKAAVGGPGALVIDGLEPDTMYPLIVEAE